MFTSSFFLPSFLSVRTFKVLLLLLLSCLVMAIFATTWTATCQASLSFTISRSLLRLMSIKSVIPFNHFFLCHPLLLPSIFPSIRDFSNESALRIRWLKYWRFIFNNFYAFCLYEFDLFLDPTYMMLCSICLSLTSLSIMSLSLCHIVTIEIISFFIKVEKITLF